jgi:hypothetical protein
MSSNRNDIIIKELTAAHEAAKARLVDLQAEFAAARREEQRLRVARGVMSGTQAETGRYGPGRPEADWQARAEWINKARADGTYSTGALRDAFKGVRVDRWLSECRRRGLLDEPTNTGATVTPA